MYVICVIPARYNSTRFPGKPLAQISGKPLIQWVFEGVRAAKLINEIIIATDDERIKKAVDNFAGSSAKSVLTLRSHRSGTDRVREAVKNRKADIIINVQGDEPLIRGSSIDTLIKEFEKDKFLKIATIAEECDSFEEIFKPDCVKLTTDSKGFALYFSRSPIPFFKSGTEQHYTFKETLKKRQDLLKNYLKHQGVYGYRKKVLMRMGTLSPSLLEKMEGLEQLRFLEAGIKIKVIKSKFKTIGVDLPEDILKVKKIINEKRS